MKSQENPIRFPLRIMFFWNGNTAALDENGQIAELQTPWLIIFAEFLLAKGIDPLNVDYLEPVKEN
jgi:hypothetical protein